jgi:hypothetical protein
LRYLNLNFNWIRNCHGRSCKCIFLNHHGWRAILRQDKTEVQKIVAIVKKTLFWIVKLVMVSEYLTMHLFLLRTLFQCRFPIDTFLSKLPFKFCSFITFNRDKDPTIFCENQTTVRIVNSKNDLTFNRVSWGV